MKSKLSDLVTFCNCHSIVY